MRAAWYDRKGPAAEVLQVGELPDPKPSPGELLVRLRASGINRSDTKGRGGARGNTAMPFERIIPHQDGAGLVEAVGDGVDETRVGERVWLYEAQLGRADGTAAELVAIRADKAVPLPDGVGFEEAACLGVPALTATAASSPTGRLTARRCWSPAAPVRSAFTRSSSPGREARES